MMKSYGFRVVWKRKRPAPSRALLLFPLRRRARRNFYRPNAHRLNTRSNDGEGEDFFFTFEGLWSVWLLFYQRFDAALLLWSSPDSWLAMFHSRWCSYIRTDDPSTKMGVHCELKHRGLHSLRAVWSIFSHQAPPSPVSSASQSPPPFPSPSLSTRRNQLSPRSPSSRKHSNVQLVPACVTSGNIHNAVSRHLDKNRAKHRRIVFSMNKAQESKQRSTHWRRRHLGNMQQQPRRWPGFDKSVKTKLRLDVYIRPWPPGWSFLRRIYTSRGSERVKFKKKKKKKKNLVRLPSQTPIHSSYQRELQINFVTHYQVQRSQRNDKKE